MARTPVIIGNYEGTCTKCGNPISGKEVHAIFISEDIEKKYKTFRTMGPTLYCFHCNTFIGNIQLWGVEWEPWMLARCN